MASPPKRSTAKKSARPAKNPRTSSASPDSEPEYIDPLKPFKWRDPRKAISDFAEQKLAVEHICRCLAQGGVELQVIRYHMIPRISKETLAKWRASTPEWNEAIDEAFEVGCALDVMKAQSIADGIQPLTYGHTTAAQRARYRQDVRRDRLRINNIWKRVEAINRRYKPRQILEGDDDHPLTPSTYQIMPVAPKAEAEDE